MDYVIGVDIGTQSTKALLVGVDGALKAQASRRYAPDTPRPSWAEQWPDVWWDAVNQSIGEIVANGGVPLADIKAICISSLYGGSGIPVGADLRPLHSLSDLDGPSCGRLKSPGCANTSTSTACAR